MLSVSWADIICNNRYVHDLIEDTTAGKWLFVHSGKNTITFCVAHTHL